MFLIVAILAIILSVLLIVMVLLQPSKGSGVGGAFGNLGATLGSTFGSRRTLDFLAKGTTWIAGVLGAICLIANIVLSSSADSGPTNNPVTTGKNANAPAAPPQIPMGGAGSAPATGGPEQGGQPAPAQPAPQGQPAPAQPATPPPAQNK